MRRPAPLLCRLPPAAVLGLVALATAARGATGPWVENDQARVRLVAASSAAAPGADPGLGVEFTLAPGWHVYWKNAGDAGYPPQIELVDEGALEDVELRYPAPHRFRLPGDLVAFGYENEVIYPLDARLRDDLPAGPAEITLHLDYLVCAERCIPYEAELRLPLEIGDPVADEAASERVSVWRDRLPVAAGSPGAPRAETRLDTPSAEGELELVVELSGPGLRSGSPDLFFAPHAKVSFGAPRFVATASGPTFRVPLSPVDRIRPLPDPLSVAWTATGFLSASGAAVAFEDQVDLALPAEATAASGSPLRRVVVVALGVLLVLFLIRRFGGRTVPTPPTDPRSLR